MMNTLDRENLPHLYTMIYNLSLNMLHNGEEAEEAAQQIMLKIVEAYPRFQQRSKVETWAYRIARNYLIDCGQREFRRPLSFEMFEEDLRDFTPYRGELGLSRTEEKIYAEQVKVGCTLAMLQCLDRESRFLYIVGSIFQIPGKEAAEICGMGHENYRKKLSRTKEKVRNFLNKSCGLVNENAPCRCRRRLLIAKERGRINLEKQLYQTENRKIRQYLEELNRAEGQNIFQDNPFVEGKTLPPDLLSRLTILKED
ncbi:MAG: sigma-70 family RNA polymerase sigma factor [Spirochaetales bacterium]|nr:sigma-70 family RNA polymerase sigma factor [Spirochaetales bacterium]